MSYLVTLNILLLVPIPQKSVRPDCFRPDFPHLVRCDSTKAEAVRWPDCHFTDTTHFRHNIWELYDPKNQKNVMYLTKRSVFSVVIYKIILHIKNVPNLVTLKWSEWRLAKSSSCCPEFPNTLNHTYVLLLSDVVICFKKLKLKSVFTFS